jgi:hypothetical protein
MNEHERFIAKFEINDHSFIVASKWEEKAFEIMVKTVISFFAMC